VPTDQVLEADPALTVHSAHQGVAVAARTIHSQDVATLVIVERRAPRISARAPVDFSSPVEPLSSIDAASQIDGHRDWPNATLLESSRTSSAVAASPIDNPALNHLQSNSHIASQ
jgi:hypothetical protein